MEVVIREFLKTQEAQNGERGLAAEEEARFYAEVPMQILTNHQKAFGAVGILYPGVLGHIAAALNANLYILPSSVHEVIVMPDYGREDPGQLRSMIWDVNRNQLEPEEVLSNSLYYYERLEQNVKIV